MREEKPDELMEVIPREQIEKVLSQPYCEIQPCFLGFTDIYKALSSIIPKHFTVIDLGCCYNAQCFHFLEHKEYIAVDVWVGHKFQSPNCRIFEMTIDAFIAKHLKEFNLKQTFAICSYVPPWYGHDIKSVAMNFPNIFTFYPSSPISPIDVVNGEKP
jgi:hypothetical protein